MLRDALRLVFSDALFEIRCLQSPPFRILQMVLEFLGHTRSNIRPLIRVHELRDGSRDLMSFRGIALDVIRNDAFSEDRNTGQTGCDEA